MNRAEEAAAAPQSEAEGSVDEDIYVQHTQHKTIHLLDGGDEKSLACGRFCGENYRILLVAPKFSWPKCKGCFGKRPDD